MGERTMTIHEILQRHETRTDECVQAINQILEAFIAQKELVEKLEKKIKKLEKASIKMNIEIL